MDRRRQVLRCVGLGVSSLALLVFGHVCAVRGGDFLAFYDTGEAALRHGDIYALGPRMHMNVFYAPTFSLLMAPFALLPPYLAAWVWYLLKLAGVAFLARWLSQAVGREAPLSGGRARLACALLPFLVAFNPFMSEFRLGQANLFVLLFSVLLVRALERGRPIRAALYFSLAAIKITPLALLPWLLFRRQWRFFFGLLVVGLSWLVALAAWWGPSRVPGLFFAWIEVTRREKAIPKIISFFENQSLQGAATRLAEVLPGLKEPLLGLAAYQWLWIVPCLAILGVLLLSAARDRFRQRLPPEEFALASLLMLLASSDSRWAHHVQLFVPLAVLAVLSARTRLLETVPGLGRWLSGGPDALAVPPPAEGARLRRRLLALLGSGVVVLVLLGRDLVGPTVNHAIRALSFHTAFDLALVLFLSRRLLRKDIGGEVNRGVTSLSQAP